MSSPLRVFIDLCVPCSLSIPPSRNSATIVYSLCAYSLCAVVKYLWLSGAPDIPDCYWEVRAHTVKRDASEQVQHRHKFIRMVKW